MPVNASNDLPAIGLEASFSIIREPAIDLAVNRNIVVIVKTDQFAELLRAGE